jgi:hypothetical protein
LGSYPVTSLCGVGIIPRRCALVFDAIPGLKLSFVGRLPLAVLRTNNG